MPADVSELLALSDDLKKSAGKIRRQVVPVVQKTKTDVQRDMKAAAPTLTGVLRDSITATGNGLKATVTATARYAFAVQWGTYKDEAQDFMNPPADSAQGVFPDQVVDAVIKALDL
jgi:HK97 gp10 family phage protein